MIVPAAMPILLKKVVYKISCEPKLFTDGIAYPERKIKGNAKNEQLSGISIFKDKKTKYWLSTEAT